MNRFIIVLLLVNPALLAANIKNDPWGFIQETIYCLEKHQQVPYPKQLDIPIMLRSAHDKPDSVGLWWVAYHRVEGYTYLGLYETQRTSEGQLLINSDTDSPLWVPVDVWLDDVRKQHDCWIVSCTPVLEKCPF